MPVVCRVDPGTSAQRQGLREGDRILGVNDHVVEREDYGAVRLAWRFPGALAPRGDIRGQSLSLGLPHLPGFRAAQVGMVG